MAEVDGRGWKIQSDRRQRWSRRCHFPIHPPGEPCLSWSNERDCWLLNIWCVTVTERSRSRTRLWSGCTQAYCYRHAGIVMQASLAWATGAPWSGGRYSLKLSLLGTTPRSWRSCALRKIWGVYFGSQVIKVVFDWGHTTLAQHTTAVRAQAKYRLS